ncbi:GIY-YIG nuclease family protein [Vibrio vulnificus]|nr:GIY-YIG nuclease family protein [Vibrio vulnificus]
MTTIYDSLSFSDIRSIRGKSLRTITANPNKVPSCPGVYIWRYWPQPRSYSKSDLMDYLRKIIEEFPCIEKEIAKNNDTMIYRRFALGSNSCTPFHSLGLTNRKIDKLEELLESDEKIEEICNVFELMLYMLPPLYIGKANNIAARISQHINRNSSKLLNKIDNAKIDYGDIYIHFIKDDLSTPSNDMSDLLEIIIQRVTNPVFTDRQG